MRRGFLIIMFMVMFNASTIIVSSLPIWGDTAPMTPYNQSQVEDSLDPWGIIGAWDPPESGGLFGDVKAALELMGVLQGFIEAFPAMIASIPYLPAMWGDFLIMGWNIVWWFSVLDFISGGKIFG